MAISSSPSRSNGLAFPFPLPNVPTESQDIYTIFTLHEKQLIVFLLSLATLVSPLTATIYFPLLPLLKTHFNTSSQAINLTITIYIIFQALSPLLFASVSDTFGRRPIYLLTFTLYVIANLGLSLEQKSYAALLVLRALQSLGASAAFAVSYGVVADVCIPSERGKMLGPVSAAQNLGTCIGPIVGGWIAWKSDGYKWVFWILLVIGTLLLVMVGGFLPETARMVVGNGTVRDKRWYGQTWWGLVRYYSTSIKDKSRGTVQNQVDDARGEHIEDNNNRLILHKKTLSMFNPLACLRIIFWKDTALILWMHGWFYLVDYCIQTTIPSTYKDIYHFNEFQIGLSYLPRGTGIIAGGYINGKIMDRNYRITAAQIGHAVDRIAGDDVQHFPIERARTRRSWISFGVLSLTLIGYGWAIEERSHVSIPLILQFVQGFLGTCLYTTFSTLLVDVFPASPSTAAAAASVTRCALAASGVAALQPLLDLIGMGWYFTALGLVSMFAGSAAVWTIRTRGMEWRSQRRLKTINPCEAGITGDEGKNSHVHSMQVDGGEVRPCGSREVATVHDDGAVGH